MQSIAQIIYLWVLNCPVLCGALEKKLIKINAMASANEVKT
jgi:hypothetical protein